MTRYYYLKNSCVTTLNKCISYSFIIKLVDDIITDYWVYDEVDIRGQFWDHYTNGFEYTIADFTDSSNNLCKPIPKEEVEKMVFVDCI